MIDELAPNPNQKLLAAPKVETVMICAWCQGINNPGFEAFSKGIDPRLLKELRIVDFRVRIRARKKDVSFSHGMCPIHQKQVYAQLGKTPPKSDQSIPSLLTDTELRRQYMRGIFTEEDKRIAQQSQQQLRERLQKLANIIKDIKHASSRRN